jgi:hypothetical protein
MYEAATDMFLAPIAVLMSAGETSNPSRARTATGGAGVDVVVGVDAFSALLPQAAARTQMPATATAVSWRNWISFPIEEPTQVTSAQIDMELN